jgi:5-methylcytosine-specific restriction endonuclease McrA
MPGRGQMSEPQKPAVAPIDSRNTTVKRERITDSVRNALWARTAGRCTICNRRLLGDHRTYLHSVLLAELAHNIGATDGDESPRSVDNDGVDDTEAEENLLLLCHDCHKIIDDGNHIDFFPPEKLRQIKESFERRIEMVTENGGLTRTAALRLGCMIRGSLAMASRREIAETLLAVNYLGLVETQRSGDFTCRITGSAGGRGFWDAAQQSIDDVLTQVRQAIDSGDVEHISVFAIAPVPLLVYLGSQLDDKTPTRLFQKHRDQFVGWSWSDHGDPVEFEVTSPDQEASAHDVVLICALTSEVNRAAFPDALNGFPVIEVRPTEVSPRPTLLAHEQSLVNFGEQWRVALATAEARFPNARRWHLVASAPVTASIESGRAFVRDIHPPVAVYERTDHAYEAVLRVNE